MQKKNSVIKNYILSSEKYLLSDKKSLKPIDNYLYREPLVQNTDCFYLFLLRK